MKICSIEGCGSTKKIVKGLCWKHYMNAYYHSNPAYQEYVRQSAQRYRQGAAYRLSHRRRNNQTHYLLVTILRNMRKQTKQRGYCAFGGTESELETWLRAQPAVCRLCGKSGKHPLDETIDRRRRLNVDHDHLTGFLRALLCAGCNSRIGWFENARDTILEYTKTPNVVHPGSS